jgi:hypothetical protein
MKKVCFTLVALCICVLIKAQLPIFSYSLPPNAAWNGTPEGLGGLALRWDYTNAVASPPAVMTDWTDLVQHVRLTWNQAGNQPIGATTGVLFTANTGNRDALTNSFTTFWTGGIVGPGASGGGTNISFAMAIRQINNNFGFGTMDVFGVYNAGAPGFANLSAATTLNMNWNAVNSTFTAGLNQIPIDIYMTWSNGIFWAWTNGILADTARNWNVSSLPWSGLQLGCLPANAPWHGNIAQFLIFTNIAFATVSPVSSTIVGVSNLHWWMTNYNKLPTNGVNSIFP